MFLDIKNLNYTPNDIPINERIEYLLLVNQKDNIINKWESIGLLTDVDDKLNLSLLFEELSKILLDNSNEYHYILETIAFKLIKYLFQNVDKKINIFIELSVLNTFLNKNYIKTEIKDEYFLYFYLQDYYNLK